jgi:hypothetical protein
MRFVKFGEMAGGCEIWDVYDNVYDLT